jgi:hypothetical protein
MSDSLQYRTCFDKKLPKVACVFVGTVTAAAVIDLATFTQTESAGYGQENPLTAIGSLGQSGAGTGISGGPSVAARAPQRGFLQCWIEVSIDPGGGNVGMVAGPTSASVSGGNAPVIATTGSPGTAGTCYVLGAGLPGERFFVGPDERFLGVVSSGTSTLRIYQSSRAG